MSAKLETRRATAKRVLIVERPYSEGMGTSDPATLFTRGHWPCSWIHHPRQEAAPALFVYRRSFALDQDLNMRVHVTADERYELYLDGERVGRGPERGDFTNWFFDTYDLTLPAGKHLFVAKVSALGAASPRAQLSLRPGFLFSPERPECIAMLGTGVADWECKVLPGYSFSPPFAHDRFSIGFNCTFDAEKMDAEAETGSGSGWLVTEVGRPGLDPEMSNRQPTSHLLYPATLPEMMQRRFYGMKVRGLETLACGGNANTRPWRESGEDMMARKRWDALLRSDEPLEVPAGTVLRVLVDLQDYLCARTIVRLGGGDGAMLTVKWAESLFADASLSDKGHRDLIDGKYFYGVGDTFIASGKRESETKSVFWRAGRYVEIVVRTGATPLCILAINFEETRYPSDLHFDLETDRPQLTEWVPLALRSLEASAHDSLIDGPYYEQMMWVGDGVQTALSHYCTQLDDRLIKKSILLFDKSRLNDGLSRARWPARDSMLIVPYAFHWVNLLYDLAWWRNEAEFVRQRLPGIRATCDALLAFRQGDGLIRIRRGWNFVDWVPEWSNGIPPGADGGASAVLNWHCVYALTLVRRLEATYGEPELAARADRIARDMAEASIRAFWDEKAALFADDETRRTFSEHGQCFAILSGLLPVEMVGRIALTGTRPMTRCTIAFMHFLFEALTVLRRPDVILKRMEDWSQYTKIGLKTLPEGPEPTRSDCHAWGAHALYHLMSSILGIRPSDTGFRRIQICPQLGGLGRIRGSMPHPLGRIEVAVERIDAGLSARVVLPIGLEGRIMVDGRSQEIHSGENRFVFPSTAVSEPETEKAFLSTTHCYL